jgi:L-2-hydroxyglutarate oxidase LhgO
MEPALNCVAALHSPETGIVDSHSFMRALQGDLEDRGGVIAFGTTVEHLSHSQAGWLIRYSGSELGEIAVDAVINAAGLGAQPLARRTEDYPQARVPPLVLARGNYFGYAGRPVFSRLIYPAATISATRDDRCFPA